MTEPEPLRLDKLEADVEHIKKIQRFMLASNLASKEHIIDVFKARAGSAQLYLALAEKPQTQTGLMTILGMKQANISKICTHLCDSGFLNRFRTDDNHFEYTWSELEQLLGISKIAKKIVPK